MKQLLTGCVAALFCLSLGVGVARPASQAAVKDGAKKGGEATAEGAKKAGEATKEGAKKTGEAAKKAGDATVDGAKKAGEATADTTEKAGTSVKNVFTGEVSATCADGTKHSGKTKAEACAKHGGVKP